MVITFPHLLLGLAYKKGKRKRKPDHRGEDSMGRRVHH
jgi:hypothetical protein